MREFFQISFLVCLGHFLLVNAYYFLVLCFSWMENRYRSRQEKGEDLKLPRESDFTIPLSVVIPAYNEQLCVLDTVYSILRNGYPTFEVIVVNDGSTDGTLALLKREFQLQPATHFYRKKIPTETVRGIYRSKTHPNLIVADKVNGGTHADAANVGVNLSRYRYVLAIDADTILEPGAMLKTVRLALRDPKRVVGVGSLIGLNNGFRVQKGKIVQRRVASDIIVNFQVLEYLRAFLVSRLGWSRGNFNMCVSGAYSLWRRDVLIEMGGFQRGFSCDDLEMTYRVHQHFRDKKIPYQIVSLPDPVCWTEAPAKTFSLYQQRHRWQRVTNETALHYWRMLFNPRYGTVGLLGAPYMWFAEVVGPWIELFSYILIPAGWLAGELSFYHLGLFLMCSAGLTSLLSLAGIALFDASYSVFRLGDVIRLSITSAAEFLGYRQVLSIARFMGTLATLRGDRNWNKFERETRAAA
jgi:cellulose synthase/poly-beta-1,6-N-acetylglucosamine synthase-like glycosyltransferase